MAGYSITLAGQDISDLVDEFSIHGESVLGQGPGAGSEGAGEASTFEFVCDLPIATAKGAGQSRTLTYIEQVLADLPSGLWRMNSELSCFDISGHANNGTINAGPLQVTTGATGDKNPSWAPDGTAYVTLPLPHVNPNTMTHEVLVYLEDNTAHGPIFGVGDWNTGLWIGIGDSTQFSGNGGYLLAKFGAGFKPPAAPIQLPLNQWVHITITVGGGTLTYYVNSVASGTASASFNTPTGNAYIGGNNVGDRAANMQIDEVAAYGGVTLSTSRIAAHYGALGIVPILVRQGEIIVKDSIGAKVFGGYLTYTQDVTPQQSLVLKTKVECHDYWQALDRTEVNEVYTGRDDVYMIKDILTKYAPSIDQSALPASGSYTFAKRLVRAKTVRIALQKIAAVTGYLIWVGPDKVIHYSAPTDASSAPFGLSDSPDFSTNYSYDLLDYEVDENAIINRVYFYGGKQESADFVQDLFPQYHGTTNKVFLLAYYPHNASDGNIHVTKNGSDLILGTPFDSGSTGKLIADGGTAQVLLNYAAETLTFDTSVLSGVTTLTCTYRYNTPLVVVVSDKGSVSYYGGYFDGKLDDQAVLDAGTAIQRSRVLLAQQAYGLVSVQAVTWQPGLQAGQLLRFINSVQGLNTTYQIQKVQIDPLGGGQFQYTVDMGAWNWNLTDLLMATARRAGPQDDEDGENVQVVQAQEFDQNLHVADVWSRKTGTSGVYYSRTSPVGDGADAYCGFCTITS